MYPSSRVVTTPVVFSSGDGVVLDFRNGVNVPVLGVGVGVVTTVGGDPHTQSPHSGVGVLVCVSRIGVVPNWKKPVVVVGGLVVLDPLLDSLYGSTPETDDSRYGSIPEGGGVGSCLLTLRFFLLSEPDVQGEQGAKEIEQ